MYTIKQPSEIIIGKNSVQKYDLDENSLLITSSGAKKRNWLVNIAVQINAQTGKPELVLKKTALVQHAAFLISVSS